MWAPSRCLGPSPWRECETTGVVRLTRSLIGIYQELMFIGEQSVLVSIFTNEQYLETLRFPHLEQKLSPHQLGGQFNIFIWTPWTQIQSWSSCQLQTTSVHTKGRSPVKPAAPLYLQKAGKQPWGHKTGHNPVLSSPLRSWPWRPRTQSGTERYFNRVQHAQGERYICCWVCRRC